MADQKKNDVADALAAMAGGAVPSETESPSGGIPSETTVFGPESTDPAPVISSAPPAPPQPTPAMPWPTIASTAQAPDQSPRTPRATALPRPYPANLPMPGVFPPPARIRPASPDSGQARERSAMPERPVIEAAPPPEVDEIPELIPEITEDDDTIAAAPDASAFARRTVQKKPAHGPIYSNLFFRRTIIPILLTVGVMLPAIAVWAMFDKNSPLAEMGTGIEILLMAVGVILLGLGIVNALHVKHILETTAKLHETAGNNR